jgi:hypothetical protein
MIKFYYIVNAYLNGNRRFLGQKFENGTLEQGSVAQWLNGARGQNPHPPAKNAGRWGTLSA